MVTSGLVQRYGNSLITTWPLLQLAVEEYFTSSGALPVPTYWLGANRTTKSAPFVWYTINTTIGTMPNDDPYIHWNWFYPGRRVLDNRCGLARCGGQKAAQPAFD
jgi:hypothetical protein